jgi:hypothetical protein
LSIIVPIGIGLALLLALCIRRSPKPREIVQSLSPADRQFIADQIEPITKLPLETIEDESAWLAATRSVMERLGTRFPDVASVDVSLCFMKTRPLQSTLVLASGG